MKLNQLRLTRPLAALALFTALSSTASANFTVTGTFNYRDRAFSYNAGFNGNEPALPIRSAEVQVINNSNGSVLSTGFTDANGDFSIFVVGSGTRDIIVRCRSQSVFFGGSRLRCVTTSNVLYSVSSALFAGWNQNTDLNVGTTISEIITSGGQEANPFNMLDMGVYSMEYITSVGNPNLFGQVDIEWPGGSGSFASGFRANIATDDGYDDTVILHELGHVFMNMYSDADSPGGSHSFGDSDQNPLLSYSEGHATFFAAAVRQFMGIFIPAIYMDNNSNGSTGTGTIGLRMRLESAQPYQSSTGGEATEVGVACVLWDVVDTTATNDGNSTDDDALDGSQLFNGGIDGDQMVWNAFTGPAAGASQVTINDLWSGFFNPTNYGLYPELLGVFDNFEIRNTLDPEEPNNSFATASILTSGTAWSSIKSLYYSASNPPAPGDHDNDYYKVNLTNGDQFDAEVRYPNGNSNAHTYADTHLYIYRPNGTLFNDDTDSGQGRNGALLMQVADQTGEWRIRVTTEGGHRETGSYQLRVFRSGASIDSFDPPSLDAVTIGAQPLTINGFGFSSLTRLEVNGVLQTLGSFPFGSYTVPSDSQILIHDVQQLSALGLIDIDVTTSTATASAQIQVNAVPLPVLRTTTANTTQTVGIDLEVGSAVGDSVWVSVSLTLLPTVYPGILTLGIGDNGTDLFTVWKPSIGLKGWRKRHYGPLSGLSGITGYWQAFALQASNGFNPPYPESNIITTVISF